MLDLIDVDGALFKPASVEPAEGVSFLGKGSVSENADTGDESKEQIQNGKLHGDVENVSVVLSLIIRLSFLIYDTRSRKVISRLVRICYSYEGSDCF